MVINDAIIRVQTFIKAYCNFNQSSLFVYATQPPLIGYVVQNISCNATVLGNHAVQTGQRKTTSWSIGRVSQAAHLKIPP